MNQAIEEYISSIVKEVVQSELQYMIPKRRTLVVANWKMNMTLTSTTTFLDELSMAQEKCTVVICPPFPLIYSTKFLLNKNKLPICVGAQNVHWKDKGAFTGQVSAGLLKELDCRFVIIGHSEVREFGETDEMVNLKVKQALEIGIDPIICVGETQDQRERGETDQVIKGQILEALKGVDDLSRVIIAYEPVWAIGTRLSAKPEQAQEVHQLIRETIEGTFGQVAEQIPILYGGSVNQDNASSLSEMNDIDGALVGGASLDARNFANIVHAFD